MDGNHRGTLDAVFADPLPSIEWDAIESLLLMIGCEMVQDDGERVTFERDDAIGSFVRPEPSRPTRRYTIRAVREYLMRLGVTP
jgi:hypothetical protein